MRKITMTVTLTAVPKDEQWTLIPGFTKLLVILGLN